MTIGGIHGVVTNVQKGQVPSQYQSLASYVAKYVVSPPLSVRRIDRYDGHRVTYHYRSHRTERSTYETVDVMTFIGRMVQHTMSKGFKRIRYYGVQATKTFAKVKAAIQAASAKSYEQLRDRHVADYAALFNRCALDLGTPSQQSK